VSAAANVATGIALFLGEAESAFHELKALIDKHRIAATDE